MTNLHLLAFSLHLNLSIKCRLLVSLEKGKFIGLAKKTNLQLPADLRHKTETTASPPFSIHNPNYNRGLRITEKKQISCIPTFSIMNGIKHICMCGFHVLATVFRSCVQHRHVTPQASAAFVLSMHFPPGICDCEG